MPQTRTPVLYHIMTALEGLAFSMILIGLLRPLSLIFGLHTVSVIIILSSALLCMALGGSILGMAADKVKHPVRIFFIITCITIIYILFQPVIFNGLSTLYQNINQTYQPGPLGTGLVRFLLSCTALIIPLSIISGSIPLLIRYFIRHISQSGRFMSVSILCISGGVLIGMFFSVFILIPFAGIASLTYASILVLFILCAIALLNKYEVQTKRQATGKVSYSDRSKSSMRFKKKKIILESGARLTKALLNGAVFQSFTFTAMFILSMRMLTSYSIVKPVLFYTLLFTVIFTGIILGSLLFKRISDRPANKFLTLATLQILTGFASLISFVMFRLFAWKIFEHVSGTTGFAMLLVKQASLFSVLLLIPTVIHAMAFPLAGRLYPKRLQHIGQSFGRLARLVFTSSISAVILTPFILIPLFGITPAFIFISVLILLSGIYLIYSDSRLIRIFRLGYAFAALLLFVVIAGSVQFLKTKHVAFDKTIEGNTASVSSIENDGGKSVYVNGSYYFGTDRHGVVEQVLSAYIPLLLKPDIHSALVSGFGTGIPAFVLDQFKIQDIYVTEIYPEVFRLSADVFSFENDDILTGARVDIGIEDTRSFLLRTSKQYDLITAGSDQLSRFSNQSVDFFNLCHDKLKTDGLFCQVLSITDLSKTEFESYCKSITSVFDAVNMWYLSPGKILVVSSNAPLLIDYCRIAGIFSDQHNVSLLKSININDPEAFISRLVMQHTIIVNTARKSKPVTDNFPKIKFHSIDHSGDISSEIWRIRVDFPSVLRIDSECSADSLTVFNRIIQLNRALQREQTSLPSQVTKKHASDFYKVPDLLIRQYL